MRKSPPLPVGFSSGRLTVVADEVKDKNNRWANLCRCACGSEKLIAAHNLRRGLSTSCGCLTLERTKETHTTHGCTVGGKQSSEYTSWLAMRDRCTNPNNANWSRYGGRGIKVCERWLISFENFLLDMGQKPSPNHSIERINVNGDYEPLNCTWATDAEQALNRSDSKVITAFGKSQPVKAWESEVCIKSSTIRARLARGWSAEDALSKGVRDWGR